MIFNFSGKILEFLETKEEKIFERKEFFRGLKYQFDISWLLLCACVCVCKGVCDRERERVRAHVCTYEVCGYVLVCVCVCECVCVCVSPRHPTVNRYLENQLKRSVRAKAALRPRPIHQKTDNETCLWPFNPNRLFHRQLINNTKECRGWTVRWVFGHDELFREASPVCWSVGLAKKRVLC